jgi:hypothetical protein
VATDQRKDAETQGRKEKQSTRSFFARRIQKSYTAELTPVNCPGGAKGSSRGWSEAEPPEENPSLRAPEGRRAVTSWKL